VKKRLRPQGPAGGQPPQATRPAQRAWAAKRGSARAK
jgi:hypothetical protein